MGTAGEIDELIKEVNRQDNKDTIKIFLILKNLDNFKFMLKYYGIPDDIFIKNAIFFEHFSKRKNEKIYSIGDSSDYFYLIVKGSIIIEEKGEIIRGIQQFNQKCILKEGFFFGDFEILNENNRLCNTYANENCILLGIKRDKFMKSLSKYIIKSRNERKIIIMNIIPCFKNMTDEKFLLYYNDFILEKVNKQNYIYKEGSIADSLYFILQGRSRFAKNGINLMYIGINDLVGYESINFELESNEKPIYNCSLIAIDDCYILRIKISNLGKLRFKIRNELNELNNERNNLINQLMEQAMKEKEKFKILYRESLLKQNIKEAVKKVPIEKIKKYFNIPSELKENKKNLNIKYLKLKLNTNDDESIKYNTLVKFPSKISESRNNWRTLSPLNSLNSVNKISYESKKDNLHFSEKKIEDKKKGNVLKKRNKKQLSDIIDKNVLRKSIGIRTNFIENIPTKRIGNYSINTGDFDLPLISKFISFSYRSDL